MQQTLIHTENQILSSRIKVYCGEEGSCQISVVRVVGLSKCEKGLLGYVDNHIEVDKLHLYFGNICIW